MKATARMHGEEVWTEGVAIAQQQNLPASCCTHPQLRGRSQMVTRGAKTQTRSPLEAERSSPHRGLMGGDCRLHEGWSNLIKRGQRHMWRLMLTGWPRRRHKTRKVRTRGRSIQRDMEQPFQKGGVVWRDRFCLVCEPWEKGQQYVFDISDVYSPSNHKVLQSNCAVRNSSTWIEELSDTILLKWANV